jgi:hypothetical protein
MAAQYTRHTYMSLRSRLAIFSFGYNQTAVTGMFHKHLHLFLRAHLIRNLLYTELVKIMLTLIIFLLRIDVRNG